MSISGNFVITRECEDPELACAFVDFFYNGFGYGVLHGGPKKDICPEEWYMGMTESDYVKVYCRKEISGYFGCIL